MTAARRSSRRGDLLRRLHDALVENATLALLVALVAAVVFVAKSAPAVGPDTWLGLVAGRELVEHGIPHEDTLTVLGQGERWTDQQWLAHLVYYGLDALGGIRLLAFASSAFGVAAFGLAVAAARSRGASRVSVLAVSAVAFVLVGFNWGARAQTLAYLMFVATLWLLVTAARAGPSTRTLLVLPLLAVWANLHGSVVLGAVLASLLGLLLLARPRGGPRGTALALAGLPPLLVLATPYPPSAIASYYRVLLLDPPFKDYVLEWRPTYSPVIDTALPAASLVAAVLLGAGLGAAALVVPERRRATLFEAIALGITFAGALMALRGIVWFGFALLVVVPSLRDCGSGAAEEPTSAGAGRTTLALASLVLVASLTVGAAQAGARIERDWPDGAVSAIRGATRDTSRGPAVYGSLLHADWILWRIPELAGRVAFDARLELYSRDAVRSMFSFEEGLAASQVARWARDYPVIVLDGDKASTNGLVRELESAHGMRIAYRDPTTVVVVRR